MFACGNILKLNTRQTSVDDIEYFRQETIRSAKNLFSAGVNAFSVQPTLQKVFIMEEIPRYDPVSSDPLSLKPALSQLFNNTLTDQWIFVPLMDKLVM